MWETHIMIDEEFQGLNLGWKAIQKFLKTKRSENLPCYIAHNRIINDNVIIQKSIN